MAKTFTPQEWARIHAHLDENWRRYALPEHRAGSVVLASFNIRKLGNVKRKSAGAFDLLARFCAQCDLIAVQEVMEDLDGLKKLREDTSARAGVDYYMLASDVTGGRGATGSTVERLAFLYRSDRVRRTAVASDISFDRSWVFDTLYERRRDFMAAALAHEKALADAEARYQERRAEAVADGRRPPKRRKPPFVSPHFVDFIRTPHAASFEIPGREGAKPYTFTAINAHLLYGDKRKQAVERRREFDALVEWLLIRAAKHKSYTQDFILLGDLNMAFDKPEVQRGEIVERIKGFNEKLRKSRAATVVNFPFIDKTLNPRTGEFEIVRSNARLTETFDQIGIFAHDTRLPGFELNRRASDNRRDRRDDYEFHAFDFANLFAEALTDSGMESLLTKREKSSFISRFQHDVSDHMPIWIRLPMPV